MNYLKWFLNGLFSCLIAVFFSWVYDWPLVILTLVFFSAWILLNQLFLQGEKLTKQNRQGKK